MQDRIEDRRSQFKKGIGDDKKWRDDVVTQIKKEKRMDLLNKKRGMMMEPPSATSDDKNAAGSNLNSTVEWTVNDINIAIKDMREGDEQKRYLALERLRRWLSLVNEPPTETVVRAGAVPILVDFLMQDSDFKLKFDAAWALTNICAGTSECTMATVECGALPYLVALLDSDSQELKEQALWCVGNIAGDCPRVRDLVLDEGVVDRIKRIVQAEMSGATDTVGTREDFLQTISWTLSNLVRGKPCPPAAVTSPIMHMLHKLIYLPNPNVQADVCWSISYLTDSTPYRPNSNDPTAMSRDEEYKERINDVLFIGCGFKLTELLQSPWPEVVSPALRCVGNILSGSDDQTQILILSNVIGHLGDLIKNNEPQIQKEALWALSNIMAGNRSQVQEVISSGCIPDVINLLNNGIFEVRREAAWTLSNGIVGANCQQISVLLDYGIMKPLIDTLAFHDEKHCLVVLDALSAILRAGDLEMQHSHMDENPFVSLFDQAGGIDRLEHLTSLPAHSRVRQRALKMIEQFFETEDSCEDEIEDDTNWEF